MAFRSITFAHTRVHQRAHNMRLSLRLYDENHFSPDKHLLVCENNKIIRIVIPVVFFLKFCYTGHVIGGTLNDVNVAQM